MRSDAVWPLSVYNRACKVTVSSTVAHPIGWLALGPLHQCAIPLSGLIGRSPVLSSHVHPVMLPPTGAAEDGSES